MDLFDLPPSENQDLVSQANIYAGQLDTLQVRLQYCQANVDPRLKSLLGKASNRFHEAVQTGRGLASLDIKAADKLVAVANKVCDQILPIKASISRPCPAKGISPGSFAVCGQSLVSPNFHKLNLLQDRSARKSGMCWRWNGCSIITRP